MCASISREDVDKPVENANGDVIGTVVEVESDRAVVEPKADVMDSTRAALDWEGAHGDTVAVREAEIETVSAYVIRLAPDAAESPADGDGSTGSDSDSATADPAAAFDSVSTSLEDVSDGLEDDGPIAEANLADELRPGTDIESVADADEADGGPAGEDVDLAAELDRGPDLESVVDGDTDDGTEEPSGAADERALTDALSPGSDLASVADADRGSDADTEPGPDIDPETIRGRETNTEDDPETVDRRIVTEGGSTVDHRPGVAGGERGAARDLLEVEPTDSAAEDEASGTAKTGPASPLTAVAAAQRAAMEPSRRAAEMGLAVQRQSARTAVAGLTRLGRQQLRLAGAAAGAPLQLTAAMLGAGDDAAGSDREPSRRLELVDGLDAMYRRRLAEAGITSLEDLARADGETVADAAGVTEQRAAGWIEQARV